MLVNQTFSNIDNDPCSSSVPFLMEQLPLLVLLEVNIGYKSVEAIQFESRDSQKSAI